MNYKQQIIKFLNQEIKEKLDENILEIPPNEELGDYAFPCFILSKKLKKSPIDISKDLEKLKTPTFIEKIEAKGPYLNFFIEKTKFIEQTLNKIKKEKDKYGSSNTGKGKKALIEHTSINPNASPHVGRARNAIIGDSVSRLLKFENYKTEIHYFVNDVGKQIAMLVLGAENKKKVNFEDLLDIYVNFNQKLKSNPKLEQKVFDKLKKLEDKDKRTIQQFKKIVDICIKGQSKILSELGINYDFYDYESNYLWNKKTNKILKDLEKTKKIFTDEDQRKVLDLKGYDLPMKVPVFVLTRGDGTSLYPLRDMAYTIEKMDKSKKNVIVLGEDHKLYFQQIGIALSLLKYKFPEIIHYSFILLQEKDKKGKMSTRQGNVVLLSDLMKQAADKSKKAILQREKKKYSKIELEKLSKQIGYGAIKFSILKVSSDKNVIFDWNQALNFEGDTGPYIQYTHVRINSILKKAKSKPSKINFKLLKDPIELKLINLISNFPKIIKNSLDKYKPSLICNYLLELSHSFNEFYHKCKVIDLENKELTNSRLLLVSCTKQVLENGLGILGIDAPNKM